MGPSWKPQWRDWSIPGQRNTVNKWKLTTKANWCYKNTEHHNDKYYHHWFDRCCWIQYYCSADLSWWWPWQCHCIHIHSQHNSSQCTAPCGNTFWHDTTIHTHCAPPSTKQLWNCFVRFPHTCTVSCCLQVLHRCKMNLVYLCGNTVYKVT